MNNQERMDMIEGLTKELASSIAAFEKAKANKNGGYVYAGVDVEMKDSMTAIRRKIILIREQLMELSKGVKL